MARPNPAFEKRRREKAKRDRREEKAKRKAERKAAAEDKEPAEPGADEPEPEKERLTDDAAERLAEVETTAAPEEENRDDE